MTGHTKRKTLAITVGSHSLLILNHLMIPWLLEVNSVILHCLWPEQRNGQHGNSHIFQLSLISKHYTRAKTWQGPCAIGASTFMAVQKDAEVPKPRVDITRMGR